MRGAGPRRRGRRPERRAPPEPRSALRLPDTATRPRTQDAPPTPASSRGATRARPTPTGRFWARAWPPPPSGRTRTGRAANPTGAGHPRAAAGSTGPRGWRAPRPGRALTEVHGLVALGALGGHGRRCTRSARALGPRPSPRRRRLGRPAGPAHRAVRAPIGSAAGAVRRDPAPRARPPGVGAPPGRGCTCQATGPGRRGLPGAPRPCTLGGLWLGATPPCLFP